MRRFQLAYALMVFLTGGVIAAEPKPEDLAMTAASDFMKALANGKMDDAMKLTATPFLPEGAKKKSIADTKEIRKKVEGVIEEYSKLPKENIMTVALRAVPFADAMKKEPVEDKEVVKEVQKALGENGYLVFLGRKGDAKDKEQAIMIFVKVKDGKAFVVSLPLA